MQFHGVKEDEEEKEKEKERQREKELAACTFQFWLWFSVGLGWVLYLGSHKANVRVSRARWVPMLRLWKNQPPGVFRTLAEFSSTWLWDQGPCFLAGCQRGTGPGP